MMDYIKNEAEYRREYLEESRRRYKKDYRKVESVEAGELTARVIDPAREWETLKIFMLRYAVYCVETGWLPLNEVEVEKDGFDRSAAVYFGVYNAHEELLACQRLIRRPAGFAVDALARRGGAAARSRRLRPTSASCPDWRSGRMSD